VARQRCAGDWRTVAIKQIAQEALVAYPEHVEAKNKTGEATVTRVDVHSGHGRASFGDGGAPMTVMDKMSNQPVIEHHGNKAELEVH